MSTHGHILLYEQDGRKKREINLYAYHDGHTSDALALLLSLPFTIFNYGKDANLCWMREESHRIQGPWFYGHFMRFFVEEKEKRYKSKDDMLGLWQATIPIDLYITSLANWISFVRFDTWNVVPDRSWCSYPSKKGDITVEILEQRACGEYHITVPVADEDEETAEDYLKMVEELLPKLNAHLPDKETHIRFEQKRQQLSQNKSGFIFPKIIVPCIAIMQELMWQDIVRARAILSNETPATDEWGKILKAYVAKEEAIEEARKKEDVKEKKSKRQPRKLRSSKT